MIDFSPFLTLTRHVSELALYSNHCKQIKSAVDLTLLNWK